MQKLTITGPDGWDVDWTKDPEFDFETEVDALSTLGRLGDELRAAREEARQIMRYMTAAVIAARSGDGREDAGDGNTVSKQAIINGSGLARQTIYDILGEA